MTGAWWTGSGVSIMTTGTFRVGRRRRGLEIKRIRRRNSMLSPALIWAEYAVFFHWLLALWLQSIWRVGR